MPDLHMQTDDRLALDRVYGGEAVYLPGETLGPRDMTNYELVWIIDGAVTYRLDDVDRDAPAGTIVLARPGFVERYTWDPRHPTRHAYFHIDVRALPRDWPQPSDWPVTRWFRDGDEAHLLFRRIVGLVGALHDDRPTRRIERMVETLIDLFIDAPPQGERVATPRYSEPVERTLGWATRQLLRRPDAEITLDDLAEAAAVSDKHLCRLFAQSIGVSPMRAVHCMRLDMAMSLVVRSNLSIKQIAARCGFASQYHFSRSFSRQYGLSPTATRTHVAQGGSPPQPRDAVPMMRGW